MITKKEMINEIKNVVMNNGGMIRLGWITIFVLNGELIRDIHTNAKKVKYEKVEQIKIYLDCIRDYEAKKVENDTEDVAEAKATKKDIIEEIKNAITSNGDDGEFRIGDISYHIDGEYVKVISWHYKDVLNDKSDEELNHHLSIIKKGIKQNIIKGLHEYGVVKCDIMTAAALETEGFITNDSYYGSVLYGEINKSEILKEMFNDVEFYEMKYNADELWVADMDDIEIVTNLCDDGYLDELKYNGDGNWYCRVNWDNVIDDFCKRWDAFFKLEKNAA